MRTLYSLCTPTKARIFTLFWPAARLFETSTALGEQITFGFQGTFLTVQMNLTEFAAELTYLASAGTETGKYHTPFG